MTFFSIFKYFLWAVGVLILLYILLVIFRSFFSTSSTPTDNSSATTTVAIASTTNNIADYIRNFSFVEWAKSFKPFTFSPVYVGHDAQNSNYSFFGDNGNKPTYRTQSELYWQNLNDAPDSHPTDYIPLGEQGSNATKFLEKKWGNGEQSSETKKKFSDKYIFVDKNTLENLRNDSVVTGVAHYKVYLGNFFDIVVLDKNKRYIGQFKAYANGDIDRNGFVPFRAVVDLYSVNFNDLNVLNGYIIFTSLNEIEKNTYPQNVFSANFYNRASVNTNLQMLFPSNNFLYRQ